MWPKGPWKSRWRSLSGGRPSPLAGSSFCLLPAARSPPGPPRAGTGPQRPRGQLGRGPVWEGAEAQARVSTPAGGSGWAVPVTLLGGQGCRRDLECSPGQWGTSRGSQACRPGGGLGRDCAHQAGKHAGGWQSPDLRPVHHCTCCWPSSQSLKPELRTLGCGQSGVVSHHRVTLNLPGNQPWTSISHPGAPIHQAASSQSLPRAGKRVPHRGTGSLAAWWGHTGQYQETLLVWGLQ